VDSEREVVVGRCPLSATVQRGMSQLSAVNPDIRTRCSEMLSGLTVVERRALKAISNDEPVEASFHLLGKFKRLGLIEHNGQRIALTGDGWMVLRLCNYGAAARPDCA